MARTSARTVRASLSDDARDKLLAAVAALGYAKLRDNDEFRRRHLYYDAVTVWVDLLPADNQETCRTLVDVIAGPHNGAAEAMAASLPPVPRNPLEDGEAEMAKVPGWMDFQNAINNAGDYTQKIIAQNPPENNWDGETLTVLQQMANGLENSLQAIFDRIERLHQKIDRIEKKIGSV